MVERPVDAVKALVFDVFGTVVDWRGSIIREGRALNAAKGLKGGWGEFADAWRSGYRPAMDRVASGELPWTKLDDLHAMLLTDVLARFGVTTLNAGERAHLNTVWHRLKGWPDSPRGLRMLKRKYVIATLSNGNLGLLTTMGKFAGLPWDCILSAELFHHYKPDPEVYLGAAGLLCLQPHEVMMVAAHENDLRTAAGLGLRTAYVHRPKEGGPRSNRELPPPGRYDAVVHSMVELAQVLGA